MDPWVLPSQFIHAPDWGRQELLWLWHWQGRQPVLLKWKKPGWHSSHFGPYTPVLHTHVPELSQRGFTAPKESQAQGRQPLEPLVKWRSSQSSHCRPV